MYPVNYEADFNPEPNRWTTFFRPLLAIPWIVVSLFWGLLFAFTHLFAWIAVTILGRYPQWLYDFNSGVVRFGVALLGLVLPPDRRMAALRARATTPATRSGSTSLRPPPGRAGGRRSSA